MESKIYPDEWLKGIKDPVLDNTKKDLSDKLNNDSVECSNIGFFNFNQDMKEIFGIRSDIMSNSDFFNFNQVMKEIIKDCCDRQSKLVKNTSISHAEHAKYVAPIEERVTKYIAHNNDENVTPDKISMMFGHDQESNPNISLDIINEGGSGMLNDFTFHNDTSIEDENDNFDHEELERMGIMSPEKLLKRACEALVFDEEE